MPFVAEGREEGQSQRDEQLTAQQLGARGLRICAALETHALPSYCSSLPGTAPSQAAPSPRWRERNGELTLDAEAGGALADCCEGMLDLDELARRREGREREAVSARAGDDDEEGEERGVSTALEG